MRVNLSSALIKATLVVLALSKSVSADPCDYIYLQRGCSPQEGFGAICGVDIQYYRGRYTGQFQSCYGRPPAYRIVEDLCGEVSEACIDRQRDLVYYSRCGEAGYNYYLRNGQAPLRVAEHLETYGNGTLRGRGCIITYGQNCHVPVDLMAYDGNLDENYVRFINDKCKAWGITPRPDRIDPETGRYIYETITDHEQICSVFGPGHPLYQHPDQSSSLPKPNCGDPHPGLSTPERPFTPPSIDNPRPSRPFSRFDSMLRGGAASAGNSVKRNCGKILLSCALDCDGMIVEGGKGALKGALKSGPLVLVDICAQKGIEKACEGLGATETQTEGSKALGGIGTGALCGAAIAGPPGAGIGAGISAGVETVCACGKIVYYLGDSCYSYGIGDTFEAWCGTGLHPIRYWCGD